MTDVPASVIAALKAREHDPDERGRDHADLVDEEA